MFFRENVQRLIDAIDQKPGNRQLKDKGKSGMSRETALIARRSGHRPGSAHHKTRQSK